LCVTILHALLKARGFSVPASDAPRPLRRKEMDTAAGAPSPVVPRCALALLEAVDEGRPAGRNLSTSLRQSAGFICEPFVGLLPRLTLPVRVVA